MDRDVQRLVYELAQSQRFECALCSKAQGLVVDHDHDPEEGLGFPYTIYNVRGLVCGTCNWHLGFYECEANGGYFGWENASCRISHREYENYINAYECRVNPLLEALREQRMGSANYWRRRLILQRFDEWFYEGGHSSWRERWAQEQAKTIKTPEQFVRAFTACAKFVIEQIKKDPDFRLPEKFIEVFFKVQALVEEARANKKELATEAGSVA